MRRVGISARSAGLRTAARVEIDERLEGQASDLLLDRGGVGVQKERVEGARIGGEIEAHGPGRAPPPARCGRSRRARPQRGKQSASSTEPPCAEWICGVIVTRPNILRQISSYVEYGAD